MTIDRAETLRYLRMGRVQPDAVLEARLSAVEQAVLAVVRPAAYWQLVPIEPPLPGTNPPRYCVGCLTLSSVKLWETLQGCRHAFLFCATLGTCVDALLRTCGHRSAADLVMAQAAATALIETYCDECEAKMRLEAAVKGETLRIRFSPGYGDLPLAVQKSLLDALDSVRRVGITLSEALLLMPSKSVSAIIGVGPAVSAGASANKIRSAK